MYALMPYFALKGYHQDAQSQKKSYMKLSPRDLA